MGASEKILMWKAATTIKMLLCFNFALVIASIDEDSKPQMSNGYTHHIACVQRWRLEEPCKVRQWLECPPDSNKDRIIASTTDASEDLTPSETVQPAPVTTQDSDPHATPSPARSRDLYTASKNGDLERVKRILATGHVDINTRGGRGSRTPVMAAAANRHMDVVDLLVSRGADVSLVDKGGFNILHRACWRGDLETLKLILSLNVLDMNARNNYGQTVADLARIDRRQQVLDLLMSHGAH